MFYSFNKYLTKNNCVKVWWIRYVDISLLHQYDKTTKTKRYELERRKQRLHKRQCKSNYWDCNFYHLYLNWLPSRKPLNL